VNTSPNLSPVDKAVILLAVCSPELAGRRLTIEGRRVRAIRSGRLALLVTYVDQQAYSPVEVERRRADAAWFAAEARFLELAVERAAAHGRVLPMRLLTVFAQSEALDTCARQRSARWMRALGRLSNKRECAVHLYAGPHRPPGGAPYVARVAQRVARNGRAPVVDANAAVKEHALAVWRDVTTLAVTTRGLHVAKRRGALWSVVLLLEERDVPALAAVLELSAEAGVPLGVSAYLEAPRAPFTFV
jgi:hypothetical protein